MKKIIPFVFVAFLIGTMTMHISCSKSNGNSNHIDTLTNCDGLITDTLGTNDSGRVYVPNAFAPNGNSGFVDESFFPITFNISSISFTVYDSLNNIVFSTDSLAVRWNGMPNNTNSNKIFYYRIQAVTNQGNKIGLCGEVYQLVCIPANTPKNFFHFEDQCTVNGFTVPVSEVGNGMPTCP